MKMENLDRTPPKVACGKIFFKYDYDDDEDYNDDIDDYAYDDDGYHDDYEIKKMKNLDRTSTRVACGRSVAVMSSSWERLNN